MHCCVWIRRTQSETVAKTAFHKEDAARFRQFAILHSGKKVVQSVHLRAQPGVIGDVAKILWSVMVRLIGRMHAVGIDGVRARVCSLCRVRLCRDGTVAFLIPAKGNSFPLAMGQILDVLADISEIACGV